MEIEKESVKDVNENDVKEHMDEQITKLNEYNISSMGQTSSQEWKDKVTSSVLHNFIVSSSVPSDGKLPNHHHSLFSPTQGCSCIQKHLQKSACAKDISIHEGNVLNKPQSPFQKNENECIPVDNHSWNCFGSHGRHRRHTWPGTLRSLGNCEARSASGKTIDGNFQEKVNLRRCRSTSCLLTCSHSTNNSSFPCLLTYERKKITEENHITFEPFNVDCPNSTSTNGVENTSSIVPVSTLISATDNNVSHLENNSTSSNALAPPLFFKQSKFYNSHKEHFIKDIINNVQKFSKEKALGFNLSEHVEAFNEPELLFNHENIHNIVHKEMDSQLSDNKKETLVGPKEQSSIKHSVSTKLVAAKSDVKKKNELEKLYDSLREIRWAQNITAKSLMMETKLRRHSVRIAGESPRKTATLSTMYKRVLPNRAIRKGDVVGGKPIVRRKHTNHTNFKGQLSPRLISQPKSINRPAVPKSKDRAGNHVPQRIGSPKMPHVTAQSVKPKNEKSQKAHQVKTCGESSCEQNFHDQAMTEKRICSKTVFKDGKQEKSTLHPFECSSSLSSCPALDSVSSNHNSKVGILSKSEIVKGISRQKEDHDKSEGIAHRASLPQNKSGMSSSKFSSCALGIANCSKAFKQANGKPLDEQELYKRWKAETCGKEEKLAFGVLRIQGYKTSSQESLKNKRKLEEEVNCSKLRPREFTLHYKGITVKRNPSYTQVIFKLNGRMNGRTHSFLSVEDMVELKETLEVTGRDPSCQVLLLTGSDDYFCSGLDLQPLLDEKRGKAACEMAGAVKELMEALAAFTKPLVIAVNGDAMGLGVTLLTYSDVVLASDNAVFSMPYSKLGYMPEGAGTLTLPQVMGVTVAADMLIRGKQLTAHQAQHHGLVSEVIKKDQLMGYAIPRVLALAKQPLHAMETTKAMMRCHLWERLQMTLEKELEILPRQWLSSACQEAITKAFKDGFFFN